MSAAGFTLNRELLLINVTNKLLAWQFLFPAVFFPNDALDGAVKCRDSLLIQEQYFNYVEQ
jgi:hypothetical protein